MEAYEEELVRSLVQGNDELRRADQAHRELKAKVDALSAKPHLSPEEELRRKELQKLKLAEKDKIMRILIDYRRSAGSSPSAG